MTYTLISESFHSTALGARRVYRLLLPQSRPSGILPLLILLHGVHGSEIDWTEQGNVQEALQQLAEQQRIGPMAILMPSDGLTAIGTGYLNWDAGKPHHYEDFILEDLIPHVERKWNVGGSKEARMISGLSMGGFAAIRFAFAYPQRFAAASSLSGFFAVQELEELIGTEDYAAIFQGQQRMRDVSPLTMILPAPDELPALYFDCGKDDQYISMNYQLHERLELAAVSHTFVEHTGAHTWNYWREHINSHIIFHWIIWNQQGGKYDVQCKLQQRL